MLELEPEDVEGVGGGVSFAGEQGTPQAQATDETSRAPPVQARSKRPELSGNGRRNTCTALTIGGSAAQTRPGEETEGGRNSCESQASSWLLRFRIHCFSLSRRQQTKEEAMAPAGEICYLEGVPRRDGSRLSEARRRRLEASGSYGGRDPATGSLAAPCCSRAGARVASGAETASRADSRARCRKGARRGGPPSL